MIIIITIINLAQRSASATTTIDFGDDFSRQSTQTIDNYDNFDQTIMDLEASQVEDPVYQAPQPANHYGATTEETCCSHRFTPLTCNQGIVAMALRLFSRKRPQFYVK